jgi:integrase
MRTLTPKQIKALLPGRHYLGDGLCLIKQPNGKVRFIFRYTSPLTRRPNETSIGPYPAVPYPAARAEVSRLRALLAKGTDPVANKREQRAVGITFAEACQGWIVLRQDRWRSTRVVKNLLVRHGKPLAGIPVSQITPQMVLSALAVLLERHPEQARRALAMWSRVFDYAKAMGMRTGDNPAAWRANMEYMVQERPGDDKHYPSMPFKRVPDFMKRLHLRQMKGVSAIALEFQIITVTRPGETRGARWSEFDLVNRIWTLPPDRTKQGRQHRIPLSERCMQILSLQSEHAATTFAFVTNAFIFSGHNRVALAEKNMRDILRNMRESVTNTHGFRSSFRDWAASMHPRDRDLAELSLGHSIKGKTEAAYWRDDGLEQRRPIMNAWSEFCSE